MRSVDDAGDSAGRLVPGRECGGCNRCCIDLAIVDDGMRKLPGVACGDCTDAGCAVYARRPQVCRDYHCLWRELGNLDESWRPDRSGVLIQWAQGGRPGFRHSVELILVGPAATLRTDDFAGLAGGFIDSGTATYLQVSHGPGFLPFRAFLNRTLGPSVAARDYAEMKRLIWAAYARMQDQPRIAATVEHFMADGAAVPLPMKD